MNTKKSLLLVAVALAFASCTATKANTYLGSINFIDNDPPITQSLFEDKIATISEENIQRILDGIYSLPEDLSVDFVRIAPSQSLQRYYWSDEEYLKSQQQYLDLSSEKFKNSSRVKKTFSIPDLLISSAPSFTSIRESAVRTQSDIVVIYSINSDIYSQYKLFSKTDIKVFATTQLVILDVRTGLIPFTTIVTKDFQDIKTDADLNENEARNRIKSQAVLSTIEEIGLQLEAFLGRDDVQVCHNRNDLDDAVYFKIPV